MLSVFVLTSSFLYSIAFNYPFSDGADGWVGDFADYPVGGEDLYELEWGWKNLPHPLPGDTKGMILSGNNHSDDLFMFIKRQISGLKPSTNYKVTITTIIQNNVPPNLVGIGGSPGESVFFKVGASTQEPRKIAENNYYRLNIDVGCQANGGEHAIVIGNLANPLVTEDLFFAPKEFSHAEPLHVQTDGEGKFWVLVGTDSGFEGISTYYVANVFINVEE